jgi:potassium/chloride transporter 4/5/6
MVATPRRAAVSEGPTLHKQITMMSQRGGSHPAPVQQRGKLGTYKGVLVPTCENMWGVIIFLRFYKIVGYSGLGYALLIASLSFMVALLTALSLSAIATCGTSQGLAGVYPMLARALGKEMATAVGLVYFLGIVFLAVLEVLGACEELEMVQHSLFEFTTHINAVRAWASAFMLALALLVAGGTRLTSKLELCSLQPVII